MGKIRKISQTEKIKNYLLKGNSLNRVLAIELNMGLDLSTRISNLRAEGLEIEDELITNKKLQKRYWMTEKAIAKYLNRQK